MADIWDAKKRSEVMSKIRSSGNKSTELKMISLFRLHGITGWRRKQNLPGKPDFTFRKTKVVVFVDGCFWHGCPKCFTKPKTNAKFWAEKISKNKTRDRKVTRALRKDGWRVVRIWEHSLQFWLSLNMLY